MEVREGIEPSNLVLQTSPLTIQAPHRGRSISSFHPNTSEVQHTLTSRFHTLLIALIAVVRSYSTAVDPVIMSVSRDVVFTPPCLLIPFPTSNRSRTTSWKTEEKKTEKQFWFHFIFSILQFARFLFFNFGLRVNTPARGISVRD